jgi:hypothetical protein
VTRSGDADGAFQVRSELQRVLSDGPSGAPAADRLCVACLPLLQVDAAAISVIDGGVSRGTYGASSAAARVLDELQFTHGEGPCMDANRDGAPVLIEDLRSPEELRWPAFVEAARRAGVQAVFAVPIRLGSVGIGALDLFRTEPGPLTSRQLRNAEAVAEAGVGTLLDMLTGPDADRGTDGGNGPSLGRFLPWARVEVGRATGMIMAQLCVDSDDALVRLRGYAFAHELSATDVSQLIIKRELRLER